MTVINTNNISDRSVSIDFYSLILLLLVKNVYPIPTRLSIFLRVHLPYKVMVKY